MCPVARARYPAAGTDRVVGPGEGALVALATIHGGTPPAGRRADLVLHVGDVSAEGPGIRGLEPADQDVEAHADLRWPMCGGASRLAPHSTPTSAPGDRRNSRTARARVMRCNVTCQLRDTAMPAGQPATAISGGLAAGRAVNPRAAASAVAIAAITLAATGQAESVVVVAATVTEAPDSASA